jgi:hypothetical protein
MLTLLHAAAPALRGLAIAAAVVAVLSCAAFVPPGIVLGPVAAALVGLALYVTLLAAVRPSGLGQSWRYLRALT